MIEKEQKESAVKQTSRSDVPSGRERDPNYHQKTATLVSGPSARQVPANKDEERIAEVTSEERPSQLFANEEAAQFRSHWDSIKASFVDEPHQAVKKADGLVSGVIHRLSQIFAEERANLEAQLDRSHDLSTEDLRLALRHYRAFFGRLLSI